MRRPQIEQANWHVTARGARRLFLFHDDADYKAFYSMLGESCGFCEMDLVADCLMSNHFHLCLGGGSNQLTKCMQRLNRSYSGYHNQRYGLSGHAFEQRYYGEPIPSEFILKRVVRYIHLNPVRGGRSTLPEEYPWSSYRRMAWGHGSALAKPELSFLGLFGSGLDVAQATYRSFTEADLLRRVTIPPGRTPAWQIWQEQFRWILEYAQQHSALIFPLEPEEVAVQIGSRAGVPPRAMGRVLGHSDGRRVSEVLRQLKDRLSNNPTLVGKIESLGIL